MKKRIGLFLTVLALALCLFPALPVRAAGFEEAQLGFVTDAAGLLSGDAYSRLEQQAQDISTRYSCGVYIITVDDFTDYTNESTPYEAAKAFYRDYSLGCGLDRSGVLLLLSMAERDYALIAYGYGNTAFTDYGKDKLSDEFLDDFGDDDWYGGFQDYLTKCDSMLEAARDGHPLDVGSNPMIAFAGIAISLLLGCGGAFAFCWWLKERQMKSVAAKTEADTYLSAGSVEITNREDRFTHTTEVRTEIEKASGGGSGGTTIDSDGFSGKSGKF